MHIVSTTSMVELCNIGMFIDIFCKVIPLSKTKPILEGYFCPANMTRIQFQTLKYITFQVYIDFAHLFNGIDKSLIK